MLRTKIHLVISAMGALVGLSAFICFCLVYANIEAGMWGLLSGLKATLAFVLHFHFLRGILHERFSRRAIEMIADLGMFGFVSGAALTIFYAFLEIYWQSPMIPVSQNIVIRLVWSFMMMKWGFLLHRAARGYASTYNDHQLFSESSHIVQT